MIRATPNATSTRLALPAFGPAPPPNSATTAAATASIPANITRVGSTWTVSGAAFTASR